MTISRSAPPPPRPLIVTADAVLRDELGRLVAAAGGEADVLDGPAGIGGPWSEAGLVLIGDDIASGPYDFSVLPRRTGVVLVGCDLDDAGVWRRAVLVGAEHVAFLPDAEPWLVERLADALTGPGERGQVVGVVGGRGGAGATSLAVALALAARRSDRDVLLVDADPLGGGIDLVLGADDDVGACWAEVAARSTDVGLRRLLPRRREMSVLSCARTEGPTLPAAVVGEVLESGRRAHDLVVVDLPRSFDPATTTALGLLDVLLVVVPAEIRACAAAAQVVAHASGLVRDVRCVVRGPAPSGLDAELVAEALGLPLAGWLRREPGIAAALERGEPPGSGRRGPLASFAQEFVAALPAWAGAGGGAAA